MVALALPSPRIQTTSLRLCNLCTLRTIAILHRYTSRWAILEAMSHHQCYQARLFDQYDGCTRKTHRLPDPRHRIGRAQMFGQDSVQLSISSDDRTAATSWSIGIAAIPHGEGPPEQSAFLPWLLGKFTFTGVMLASHRFPLL